MGDITINNKRRIKENQYRKEWKRKKRKEFNFKEKERENECARYLLIRLLIDLYKENEPCKDCLKYFPAVCMDFDHVKGKKLFQISNFSCNLNKLTSEIQKCDLVCANCHRLRTWRKN